MGRERKSKSWVLCMYMVDEREGRGGAGRRRGGCFSNYLPSSALIWFDFGTVCAWTGLVLMFVMAGRGEKGRGGGVILLYECDN